MGWHLHIFDKLTKVWRHLNCPDDGWKDWPGSRRDQCTLASIEDKRTRRSSRASEATLRHWATRINKHTLDRSNDQARAWLQQVEDKHKKASTADHGTLTRPLGEAHTIAQVCAVLRTGEPSGALRDPPMFDGRPMPEGEWIWYQLLRDTYRMPEFDFLFHFAQSAHETQLAERRIGPAPVQPHNSDTLQAVQKIWRPDLTPDFHVRNQWPGHYILYRVDQDTFERSLKMPHGRWSNHPHGWFGAQRVLRVPVSLTLNDDLLNWHDTFPDPADGPYESKGLLAQIFDGTVDLFGYDPFTRNDSGKFLATLMRTRRDDARGLVFARERKDKTISCYRIWLHEVEKEEDFHNLQSEVKAVNARLGSRSSVEEKWREFRQNAILFQTVAQLLAERRYSMISYLFAPAAVKESDLAKRARVKAIKPFPLSHVIFTANLQPR